ncbi:MAG: hypothetical protein AB7P04_02095 [Bacteriovoracia bacterium]
MEKQRVSSHVLPIAQIARLAVIPALFLFNGCSDLLMRSDLGVYRQAVQNPRPNPTGSSDQDGRCKSFAGTSVESSNQGISLGVIGVYREDVVQANDFCLVDTIGLRDSVKLDSPTLCVDARGSVYQSANGVEVYAVDERVSVSPGTVLISAGGGSCSQPFVDQALNAALDQFENN